MVEFITDNGNISLIMNTKLGRAGTMLARAASPLGGKLGRSLQ